MIDQKFEYLFSSAWKRFNRPSRSCPSCGHAYSELVQRKYFFTELRECAACRLYFRYPPDTNEENREFYQATYSQGFTSDCPTEDQLIRLVQTGFQNHEKDYSVYIKALRALGVSPGAKVIDFGCSWGYGTWQLKESGYLVQGFEISRPRAGYGRERLQLAIVSDPTELIKDADIFFSAHVLEHVPSIHEVIDLARNQVKSGGMFVAFTPNGSAPFKEKHGKAFKKLWGKVHPNLLTGDFYQKLFAEQPLLISSSPYDFAALKHWDKSSRVTLDLSGDELMAIAVL